jgi:hypothetical protein
MPLQKWSKNLFFDRMNFDGALTRNDIQDLVADQDLKVLQFQNPVEQSTWELLNEEFFPQRPEVQLRAYSFYAEICDLSFASLMTNVRHFSADSLLDAVGVEYIARMDNLESLGVGIYHLEDFSFLNQVTPGLKKLFLGWTKSKKPDLSPLSRFTSLERIYIEGQQKNIEVLSQLESLRFVILRSISTPDITYLKPLHRMESLDIKLGGIRDLNAINGMGNIKYLELWQIRKLSDLGVVSSLTGLQFLFLESLRHVTALPSFDRLSHLRRICCSNMKALQDFHSLEYAPALEDFIYSSAQNQIPENFIPLLRNPKLKRVMVNFGSQKKNERFKALAQEYDVAVPREFGVFEFR